MRGNVSKKLTVGVAALLALVTITIQVNSPVITVSDSIHMIPLAIQIVDHHELNLDNNAQVADGLWVDPSNSKRIYSIFPVGPALLAVPWVVARNIGHALFGTQTAEQMLTQHKGSTRDAERQVASIIVGLTTALIFLIALEVLDGTRRRRLLTSAAVAIAFAFATGAWSTASRALWQHGPSMLFLAWALLLAARSRRTPNSLRWIGLALAGSYLMRPTNLIPAVLFVVWIGWRHRRQLPFVAGGLLLVLIPWAILNLHCYHTVLPIYYRGGLGGTTNTPVEALTGTLVSPARGLFVFDPLALVSVAGAIYALRKRRFDGIDVAVWLSCVLMWIANATQAGDWWMGHAFGPRRLVDFLPLLVFAALPVLQPGVIATRAVIFRSAATGVLAVLLLSGLVINGQGALLWSTDCWNSWPSDVDTHHTRLWNVRDGQFLIGLKSLYEGHKQHVDGAKLGCPTTYFE